MSSNAAEVVIVGGGIAGISTAYYLAKAGVASTVIEKNAIGSHASGFAYGGLGALGGPGIPGPAYQLAAEGMRLHRELAADLAKSTDINIEFREWPTLSLEFSQEDAETAKDAVAWQQEQPGYSARWMDPQDVRSVDDRISDAVLGGVYVDGTLDVDPYRLMLALTQSAEAAGVTVRHGTVTGLKSRGGKVKGVVLEYEEVPAENVVLAMGPWGAEASSWIGQVTPVTPLKGQILRMRVPGPPVQVSIGWEGNYATTKPDGLLWAGTTEEEAGFDETLTTGARDSIMAKLLKMLPSLGDAQLVRQTACLRPLSADRLPILGRVPNIEGVYVATGGGRKGIVFGPAMGRTIADLITHGTSVLPIEAFSLGRFAR